ncbi:hypothetical protein BN1012_Phect2615 [Candidatus Phaeomarinobacter ectocarpi]|uniref:Uncharacterized protein n=1 Tax=Candidatus Phaeomarinibacter ectocarpi TaxID=1458461 RepID=X5MAG3_9HYPH|nr:hypothetical protein BN1012_Phect2615 [Candidatus Phaeomarinobacter ectocarpi]
MTHCTGSPATPTSWNASAASKLKCRTPRIIPVHCIAVFCDGFEVCAGFSCASNAKYQQSVANVIPTSRIKIDSSKYRASKAATHNYRATDRMAENIERLNARHRSPRKAESHRGYCSTVDHGVYSKSQVCGVFPKYADPISMGDARSIIRAKEHQYTHLEPRELDIFSVRPRILGSGDTFGKIDCARNGRVNLARHEWEKSLSFLISIAAAAYLTVPDCKSRDKDCCSRGQQRSRSFQRAGPTRWEHGTRNEYGKKEPGKPPYRKLRPIWLPHSAPTFVNQSCELSSGIGFYITGNHILGPTAPSARDACERSFYTLMYVPRSHLKFHFELSISNNLKRTHAALFKVKFVSKSLACPERGNSSRRCCAGQNIADFYCIQPPALKTLLLEPHSIRNACRYTINVPFRKRADKWQYRPVGSVTWGLELKIAICGVNKHRRASVPTGTFRIALSSSTRTGENEHLLNKLGAEPQSHDFSLRCRPHRDPMSVNCYSTECGKDGAHTKKDSSCVKIGARECGGHSHSQIHESSKDERNENNQRDPGLCRRELQRFLQIKNGASTVNPPLRDDVIFSHRQAPFSTTKNNPTLYSILQSTRWQPHHG